MCKRRSVHTCLLCNTLISLCVNRDMHNKEQISTGMLLSKGGGLLDVVAQ